MASERKSITQSFVNKLGATDGKDVFIRDSKLSGFAVRVNPRGVVTFIIEGRIKRGPSRRLTIGKRDVLSLAKARDLAKHPLSLMAQGIDPRQHRLEQEAAQQKADAHREALDRTLSDVWQQSIKIRTLRPKTERDYRYVMNSYLSDWLPLPIRSITRQMVEQRFFELRDEIGLATASKVMRYLSAIFNLAMADDTDGEPLLTSNPTAILKQKRIKRAVPKRETYLNESQISTILHYADTEGTWPTKELFEKYTKNAPSDQGVNYILLLLFTGMRKTEALKLRWADVDMVKKVFTTRDTKNHSHQSIPMSDYVQRLFTSQKAIAGNSLFVFPSAKSKSGHMTDPKIQVANIIKATGVDFMLHDLRRTFATHALKQGMDLYGIGRALNHRTQGGITAQYINLDATIETLRPVFDAVARGYLEYLDPTLSFEIYNPEAAGQRDQEQAQHLKDTADQGTSTSF